MTATQTIQVYFAHLLNLHLEKRILHLNMWKFVNFCRLLQNYFFLTHIVKGARTSESFGAIFSHPQQTSVSGGRRNSKCSTIGSRFWFTRTPHLPLPRCRLGGGSSLSPTYHSIKPSRASFIFIPLRAASDLKRNLSDSGISKRYSTSLSSCGTVLNKIDHIIMPLLHIIIPVSYMSYMRYMIR